jgi:hypothetical protein
MLAQDVLAQKVTISLVPISTPNRKVTTTGTFEVFGAINTVAKGMPVLMRADTAGSGATSVTSLDWTFVTKPTGSNPTINTNTRKDTVWFNVDSVGTYIVQVAANGGVTVIDKDTIFVSTYYGIDNTAPASCACHSTIQTSWQATGHATQFYRGVTGNLEVDAMGYGTYSTSCIKCHTVGWDSKKNNGNFGYLAAQTGWDTTWYKGLRTGNLIPKDSMGIWNSLTAGQKMVGTIGCESCHGPATDHRTTMDKAKISKSYGGGACLTCHDAPGRHAIGDYWKQSTHSTMALSAGEATRTSCWPCHGGGAGLVAYVGGDAANYAKYPVVTSISCVTCHDPHDASKPYQLRVCGGDTVSVRAASYINFDRGGNGKLCMTCHQGRSNVLTKIKTTSSPYYGWGSRFYNHYSGQGDMLFGYSLYAKSTLGVFIQNQESPHLTATEDACVTCHMQKLTRSGNVQANHTFKMDSAGVKDLVGVCRDCHPGINTFDDIKAHWDYDHNGVTEGFQTEIKGLLDTLAKSLPKDAVTGLPITTNTSADSLAVKNKLPVVIGLWNYNTIKNDGSFGIHNPSYVRDVLFWTIRNLNPSWVDRVGNDVPGTFAVDQNFPNPFNPETTIKFAIPENANVTIEIFDILGKRINTIVNEFKTAASYQVKWNGTDASCKKVTSGIYIYRVQAGKFTATKKMVMVK